MPPQLRLFDTVTEAVAEYEKSLETNGLADRTRLAYLTHAEQFARWVDAKTDYDGAARDPDVRDYAVRDYLRYLATERNLAAASIGLHHAAINSLYRWTSLGKPERGRGAKGIPIVRHGPKALTEDEARKLLRSATKRGPRDLAIVCVGLHAALRVAEVRALNVADVVLEGQEFRGILVRYGKGGVSRAVSINSEPKTIKVLKDWRDLRDKTYGDDDPAFFLARSGQRMSVRSLQHVVTEAGRAVGLNISPHVLRHSFGSRWMEKGRSLTSLQEVMGHRNIATTGIYARPTRKYLDAAMADMEIDW